jgi:hypothetical protein
MSIRRSRLAYVVIRLSVGGRDCFLFRAHTKWGDWSLVGGHVEANELSDWARAARREAEEELQPLCDGRDFSIIPIANGPRLWGPIESRSANGASTLYEAEWFGLIFLRDPLSCLAQLPRDEFLLIDRQLAVSPPVDANIAPLLARLDTSLPGGLSSVPLAWPSSVDGARLSIAVRRAGVSASSSSAGLGLLR